MNLYIKVVFLLVSLAISSKVIAQPAFKLSGYSYEVMEEGTSSDTVKLEVKVYDKDSLLLFDTLWNYANTPVSMIVTVYEQNGQKKSRYTKAGDKFEQNILFVRDAEGRLIEQVFTGSDAFRLKTIYQFDAQGRIERAYLTSGSNGNVSGSMIKYYYNEEGQEIAQETYILKKLHSREKKEYDESGRIIKNIFFDSRSGEKTEEQLEYNANGVVIRITHYTNDILDFVQDNKWSGKLPESSQVKYYPDGNAVEYISFRKESMP